MVSDFYQTQMGQKFFGSDIPKLLRSAEKIGSELEKLNTNFVLTNTSTSNSTPREKRYRYKELLNGVIDYLSVNENCHSLIDILLDIGFTPLELTEEFNFNAKDVEDRMYESTK